MEGGIMDSPSTALTNSADDNAQEGWFSPKRATFRFLGLVLMCFVGFGSYFCYDNPGALQDKFTSDLNMSTSKFVWLYSIYSWPNIIFCFIGGFLLDRVFGIRLGTIIYMLLTMVGQFIFAMGGYTNTFWLMMVGRFIFGIGGESLAVAQNSYAVLWFKGKELNMVFGLQLSFARVGSTVNFLIMEYIYTYVSQYYSGAKCLGIVLFLSALTCVGSMMCALILGLMDRHMEKVLRRGEGEEPQLVQLKDIKDFKGVFWLISIICISYYIAIYPFIALGKVFFERKYDFSPAAANTVNSLVYSISAFAAPLLGLVIDKTGRNVFWVTFSIIGSLVAHGILAFTYVTPYLGMIVLGLSYSMLASSLWPLIALVTPEYQLGTAYGTAQAVQNFGTAITSIITGQIVEYAGYFMLEMFFLAWLWISLITIIVIWLLDSSSTGGYLNMTVKEREIYNKSSLTPESLEREKLLAGSSTSDLSADDLLQPQSDTTMRNRYLARIGAAVVH